MNIKVLGPGCPRCEQAYNLVLEAVKEAGIEAEVQKVSDTMQIAGYGVFGTPAVVINEQVKIVGKIPSKEQVIQWIT